MKNASVVIALVVGLVLGLVVGRMTVKPATGTGNEVAAAANPALPKVPTVAAANDADPTYKVLVGDGHVKGNADAPVTIVEFSDYQCPFCGRVEATIGQIEKTYGDQVRFVFKNNPLPFHQHAQLAAEAAEAAAAQGKFWEMHDKLFASQQALTRPDLEKYAQDLGLDMAKFKSDLDAGTYKAKIAKDQAEARNLGASGTPSFFINGKFVRGAQPFPKFKEVIDAELAHAKALLEKGVAPASLYDTIVANGKTSIQRAQPQQQQPQRAQFAKVPVGDGHVKGPADAKVTIVEWSDYQCPFCGRVEATLHQIEKDYGNDVRLVFKNQPLPFHQYAHEAAMAAEAAAAQGKFWEMHDLLFANQRALTRADLEKYAQQIGLNMAKFKAALDNKAYDQKLKDDSAEGMRYGARGTPTFFINGRLLSGAQPYPSFKSVIDEEIKKADKLLADGTPKKDLYAKLLDVNEKEYASAAPAPTPARPAPAPDAKVDIKVGDAPVRGPANAPVTIIEFSDYQCPFCGRVEPTIKQIEETYGNKVRVAFKNQPLPFHQYAQEAAEAAMAAKAQGKFWQMHDLLFANQRALTRADLEKYAQQVGLNMAKFKSDLDNHTYAAQVKADSSEGMQVGANGTPTFFINGRKVVGAVPFANFKSVIDEELAKKN